MHQPGERERGEGGGGRREEGGGEVAQVPIIFLDIFTPHSSLFAPNNSPVKT